MKRKTFLDFMGISSETLSKCSSAEQIKYKVIVILVFVPVLTGALGAFFLTSYLTDSCLIQLVASAVWGAIVFLVERAVVVQGFACTSKGIAYWLRWVLALSMGLLISSMLMVRIFAGRIDIELQKDSNERAQMIEVEYERKVAADTRVLTELKNRRDSIEKAYLQEIDGEVGSGLKGNGPAAKMKKEALERASQEYQEMQEEVESNKKVLAKEKQLALGKNEGMLDKADFLSRLEALAVICKGSFQAFISRMVLGIVMILIETMAMVLAHTIKGSGEYQDLCRLLAEENNKLQEVKSSYRIKIEQLKIQAEAEVELMKVNMDKDIEILRIRVLELHGKVDLLSEVSAMIDESFEKVAKIPEVSYRMIAEEKIKQLLDEYFASISVAPSTAM